MDKMDKYTKQITKDIPEVLLEATPTKRSSGLRTADFQRAFQDLEKDATFLLDSSKNGSPKRIVVERVNGKQKVIIRDY